MGIVFFKNKPVSLPLSKQLQAVTEAEDFDDPWTRLAAEIVAGAIKDWRGLIKKKAWKDAKPPVINHRVVSFDELRGFFSSEWCDFLMQNFQLRPERILQLLEEELQEAIEKDRWRD